MVDQTNRLALDTYAQGEDNWDHTDTVELFDELAIDKGPLADRPSSGSYDDQFFYATDQRTLWRWDAGTSDWNAAAGLGTNGDPIPGTSYFENVDAGSLNTDDATITKSVSQDEQKTVVNHPNLATTGLDGSKIEDNYRITTDVSQTAKEIYRVTSDKPDSYRGGAGLIMVQGRSDANPDGDFSDLLFFMSGGKSSPTVISSKDRGSAQTRSYGKAGGNDSAVIQLSVGSGTTDRVVARGFAIRGI